MIQKIQKPQQIYFDEKGREMISAIRNTINRDAGYLTFVTTLERYLDKNSIRKQELMNCHAVYDTPIVNKRRVCVTIKIKKNTAVKSPFIQIRLFSAKEDKILKQVAYVNFNLNDLKKLP